MEEQAGFPLLDAILLLHRSLGLMSELSPALLLPFSPLLRSVLDTTKLALTNFLRAGLCTVCGLDGTTVHSLPGWTLVIHS